MKLLIFGDIFGRIGRNALIKELPKLINKYNPDFVIANVDNLSSGRGAIEKHVIELREAGVDIMTAGDHFYDNFDKIKSYIDKEDSPLLRFENLYDKKFPGKGHRIFKKNGKKLLIIHLQGEVFMQHNVNNPFLVAKDITEDKKDKDLDGIVIDFHREVTSEIYGLTNYLDGDVSLIFGTHTHVQTNDEMITEKGTGMISDVGMCGSYNSVIGADYESVKDRFLTGINKGKIEQSLDKGYIISGLFAEIKKGKCIELEKIKIIKK